MAFFHLLSIVLIVLTTLSILPPQDVTSLDYRVFAPMIQTASVGVYVANDGNDANPGTFLLPWRTVQHAADTAPPGSIVFIRAGIYSGFTLTRPNLTLSSYAGETAHVAGEDDRLTTVKVQNVNRVVIRNLVIEGNPLQYGTGLRVENSSNIRIEGNTFRDNQGFGLVLKDVSDITVANNNATRNGGGIEVRYGSANVRITSNQIYANDRIIDNGRAAVGITFYRTTGPVTAENNLLWENHTTDPVDPEGSAFEIYAASNIYITGNRIWENEMVLETGTDSVGTACSNITFIRNIAYRIKRQQGLILRCASNSLIAQNTFDGLDKFTFDISHNQGSYGGSVEGLRILNNIAVNGRVYSIDSSLPASVEIDYNLAFNSGSDSVYGRYLAYVIERGNTNSFAEFQSWTQFESHGLSIDPLFANATSRDYHLTRESSAIDQGIPLDFEYSGSAPDMGRYEYDTDK